MENMERNDSKKLFTTVALVMLLVITVTGATYAFFAISATNDNTITGEAATVSLGLTVTPADLKTPNTGKMVPQLPAGIGTAVNSTNQCVDGNGNIVCKVYTITVTNNSSATVVLNGRIKFGDGTNNYTGNVKWRRLESATAVSTTETTGAFAQAGIAATTGWADLTSGGTCRASGTADAGDDCTDVSLAVGASTSYYVVVWINEINAAQNTTDAGQTFVASVNFEAKDGTGVTSTILS